MRKKLTDKKKLMAYVLNKDEDFGYTMENIGKMMGVSQSTISAAIKDVTLRKQIYDLQTELNATKALLGCFCPSPRKGGLRDLPKNKSPLKGASLCKNSAI